MIRNVQYVVTSLLVMAATFELVACAVSPPAPPPLAAVPMPPPPPPPRMAHPAYLRAMSDLRAARWLIEHRPGDWAQTSDEQEAVRRIDAALNEMRAASIDDGKNVNEHPPVDEHPDHPGRLREALEFLRKARIDVAQEEDNAYAAGLRNRAIGHIDGAMQLVRRAIHEGWADSSVNASRSFGASWNAVEFVGITRCWLEGF